MLRDEFAKFAMNAIVSRMSNDDISDVYFGDRGVALIADHAYKIADAMMKHVQYPITK
jgi:hypothetical protein